MDKLKDTNNESGWDRHIRHMESINQARTKKQEVSVPITIEQIKNIADGIIKDNQEWVNDSHSASEYEGMVNALHMLIEHLEEK